MEMQKKKLMFIITAIVLAVDYLIKFLLTNKNFIVIKNFFSLKYTENYGAAWSIMNNQRLLLIMISLAFLICLFKYSFKFKNNNRNKIAFGLVFGGLLGNLLDRIIYGYVRDFISLQFGSYYYPIFNIADIAIVLGIILVVIAIIKKEDENAKD